MSRNSLVIGFEIDPDDFARFERDVLPAIDSVGGALEREEAYFLYKTARELEIREVSPHIVEIGSFQGKSTVALGLGLLENPHGEKIQIHSIDPFDLGPGTGRSDNYDIFRKNIAEHGVDRFVVPHRKTSIDALAEWDRGARIALLWIDGAHEAEFVREDFLGWGRYLVTEIPGILAMHDSYWAGVNRVLLEDVLTDSAYRDFALIRSLCVARKHKGAAKPRDLALRRRFRLSLESRRAGLFRALRRSFTGCLQRRLGWLRAYPPR